MLGSHRGVYIKILNLCYQYHESSPILLTIILFFGFYKWRPSWILPIMQYLMTFQPHTMSGIPENPIVDIKIMLCGPFCRNDGNLHSLTFAVMVAILDSNHNAMAKIISGHTIMSGIPGNHMVDTKVLNQLIF